MVTTRWLIPLTTAFLMATLVAGCAGPASTPTSAAKVAPTPTPGASGVNPVARLGLSGATSIEILALSSQGSGGQPGYSPRLAIFDAATVARVLDTLNTNLAPTDPLLCIPEFELRFHVGSAIKKLMYSCEGASFLRGADESLSGQDFEPPAAFDSLMHDLLASPAPRPPAVAETAPEQAEFARDAALAIIAREQPGQAPSAGLPWQAKRTTPPQTLGYETWQFAAKNWVVTVGYPVVPLESTVYHVTVVNQFTGARWERDLPADQVPMGLPSPARR